MQPLSPGFTPCANTAVASDRPAISNTNARRRIATHPDETLGPHHLAKGCVGELAIESADAKLDTESIAREAEFLADIVGHRADTPVVENALCLAVAARDEVEAVTAIADLADEIVADDPELGLPVLVLDAGELRAHAPENARIRATRQRAGIRKVAPLRRYQRARQERTGERAGEKESGEPATDCPDHRTRPDVALLFHSAQCDGSRAQVKSANRMGVCFRAPVAFPPGPQTQRPPSTSTTLPVRKPASSEARNSAVLATSRGVENRPSGIGATKAARRSGVSSPMKVWRSGVSPATGAMTQTRILSGASSTAMVREITCTAPLVPLYQARPGRGRSAAVEPILMKTPPPCLRMTGTAAWAER